MTNYSARLAGKSPNSYNQKDGPLRGRKRRGTGYEAAGFTLLEPPAKWSYTWQGVFPVFRVAPGKVNGLAGLVARCELEDGGSIIEWFEYGTDPETIKSRLDDLILEIMRSQAEAQEYPIDWQPGEEIDIDLWMTRPAAAARQRTPAVRDDEIILERGE